MLFYNLLSSAFHAKSYVVTCTAFCIVLGHFLLPRIVASLLTVSNSTAEWIFWSAVNLCWIVTSEWSTMHIVWIWRRWGSRLFAIWHIRRSWSMQNRDSDFTRTSSSVFAVTSSSRWNSWMTTEWGQEFFNRKQVLNILIFQKKFWLVDWYPPTKGRPLPVALCVSELDCCNKSLSA